MYDIDAGNVSTVNNSGEQKSNSDLSNGQLKYNNPVVLICLIYAGFVHKKIELLITIISWIFNL